MFLTAFVTLSYKVFDFFHIVEPYFWLWLVGIVLIAISKEINGED